MVLLCSVVNPSARGFFFASGCCGYSGPARRPCARALQRHQSGTYAPPRGPPPRGHAGRHRHRAQRRGRERRQPLAARRRGRRRGDPPGRRARAARVVPRARRLRVRRRQGHPGVRAPGPVRDPHRGADLAGRPLRRGAPARQSAIAAASRSPTRSAPTPSRSRPSAPALTGIRSPKPPASRSAPCGPPSAASTPSGSCASTPRCTSATCTSSPDRFDRVRPARAGSQPRSRDQPARRCWRR